MIKKCKDCEAFHIMCEPIKGFDSGQAECRKFGLITEFLDHRKLDRMECIEEKQNVHS